MLMCLFKKDVNFLKQSVLHCEGENLLAKKYFCRHLVLPDPDPGGLQKSDPDPQDSMENKLTSGQRSDRASIDNPNSDSQYLNPVSFRLFLEIM